MRQGAIFFTDTNLNFLFGEDHKQLRYEDCVLAQGALIQVQQTARAWDRTSEFSRIQGEFVARKFTLNLR